MNSKSILVIEDEVIAAQYLIDILESLGFEDIYEASNENHALDIVKNNHIDLVFMDININGAIDGITCAKTLNKLYYLPIIFTTAYGDSNTIKEAMETNTFGYLIKPFELNDVEATLLIALKRINDFSTNKEKSNKKSKDTIDLDLGQQYNLLNKTFTVNNKVIDLTKKELKVLYVFCKNLNNNISYDTLKEIVWKNKDISNSTIRDTISRLKKKTPDLKIENIVNFGYILKR